MHDAFDLRDVMQPAVELGPRLRPAGQFARVREELRERQPAQPAPGVKEEVAACVCHGETPMPVFFLTPKGSDSLAQGIALGTRSQ